MPAVGSPLPTLLDFLCRRFPKIPPHTWEQRIRAGKVLSEEGEAVGLDTAYRPDRRLFYFREVDNEPGIPFQEEVIFANDHLLVACKPHFLPVTPTGPYLRETLLNRLREKTGNPDLSPINRIDRETAGLVLLSTNPRSRGVYQRLLMTGDIDKSYEAVTLFPNDTGQRQWLVENRIETGEPWFRMQVSGAPVNARTRIRLIESDARRARFELQPLTGKKHQLRLHLSGLGFPILHDRWYPDLLPKSADDYSRPLQLLSKRVAFRDPITGREMVFTSSRRLSTG